MKLAQDSLREITRLAKQLGRTIRFMEVCGTHTMAAFRTGLRSLLPEQIKLLSGPGCPVCVTPTDYVNRAVALARQPDILVTTFGDMIKVPGTEASLEQARAQGAAIRVVYSPLDALAEAQANPSRTVVFLGVGFETTAPTTAWALQRARQEAPNFFVLCGHKTMPRAMAAILEAGECAVEGFICPGHVSVITGTQMYEFIARDHQVPCVVTGFEGADLAEGILMLLRQRLQGRAVVEVQYTRSVEREGNPKARAALDEVFEPCDAEWRGFGTIPGSGLSLKGPYVAHDAGRLLRNVVLPASREPIGCRCGEVLRGLIPPSDCPLFGKVCTPDNPIGACMVSSEGACAAYHRYGG